ncbi:hypothetical protein [Neptunomonas sp. XY-337]|uniref:hypothetical protein n=1 Tax=Neptunomonas sp. XY-337 TaxID=2561897 RepID=UPI0010AA0204|nr:hypothetical protein [Neptunomonas sp. XY-337]
MGIQDRDWYWEDRKNRDRKYGRVGEWDAQKFVNAEGNGKPPSRSRRTNKWFYLFMISLALNFVSGKFIHTLWKHDHKVSQYIEAFEQRFLK